MLFCAHAERNRLKGITQKPEQVVGLKEMKDV